MIVTEVILNCRIGHLGRGGGGEGGSDGEGRGRGDEYTYRIIKPSHLEVIEGEGKMKNFRKLLRNSP